MEVKSLFKRIGVEPLVVELDQLGNFICLLQKILWLIKRIMSKWCDSVVAI